MKKGKSEGAGKKYVVQALFLPPLLKREGRSQWGSYLSVLFENFKDVLILTTVQTGA